MTARRPALQIPESNPVTSKTKRVPLGPRRRNCKSLDRFIPLTLKVAGRLWRGPLDPTRVVPNHARGACVKLVRTCVIEMPDKVMGELLDVWGHEETA